MLQAMDGLGYAGILLNTLTEFDASAAAATANIHYWNEDRAR
jgi:hypothetical protein